MTTKLPIGTDNFEVALAMNFRGYVSSIDPTMAPADVMVRGSQNVYKTAMETLANRPGRKTYDSDDSTVAGVKAGTEWSTSLGSKYLVRVANSKFQVLSTITGSKVWYDLLTGLTVTRGVFDTWWNNTLKKDQLLFVLGNGSLYKWGGGMGLLNSATTTATVIGLSASAVSLGFEASGSVLINGTTYTYSGISGSTLTGVGSDPTGNANQSVVIQAVTTSATTPASDTTTFTNDFLKVVNNQVHIGSYISRLIYISEDDDYLDYTVPGTRVAGDPELLVLDDNAKGIGVRQGKAHIFAGTSDLYIITFRQITVGSTLTEQTEVDKRKVSALGAAYAHEFIDSTDDSLVWLTQDQQLRSFGFFADETRESFPVLSYAVATDLTNETFTLGHLRIISTGDLGDVVYIVAPNTGITYLYQIRTYIDPQTGSTITERLWQSPFVWGLSRIAVISGTIVGFSNSNPQTYELWNTGQWHDDSPSGHLSYTSVLLASYQSLGRRQGKLNFDKVYWEGYMTVGTPLFGGIYYDYQGASGLLSPIIHSIVDNSPANSQSFFTGIIPPSLGDASLGDNPLGDITAVINFGTTIRDRDLLPKFRIITTAQLINCFEFALMAYSTKEDARWELICFGANVSLAPFSAVEIVK